MVRSNPAPKPAQDGLFSLDIALEGPHGRVVVEVDGPYHFAINTRHPTGATLIRCRGRVRRAPVLPWLELRGRRKRRRVLTPRLRVAYARLRCTALETCCPSTRPHDSFSGW